MQLSAFSLVIVKGSLVFWFYLLTQHLLPYARIDYIRDDDEAHWMS